jgi:SulP family sulfate permease
MIAAIEARRAGLYARRHWLPNIVAVNVGVILAVLHFMRRMAASVETERLEPSDLQAELRQAGCTELPAGVVVYEITGPMFFGAVENLERALLQTHTAPAALVIRLRRVPFIDITGIQSLQEAIGQLQRRGVRVLMCEANARVRAKLTRAGLFETLPAWDCVEDFAQAITQIASPTDTRPCLSVVEPVAP